VVNKIHAINRGLSRKFPGGQDPFRIMTRLLEEGGELAQQVNHFENAGLKRQKHGEPDRDRLAQEAKGVLLAVFQLIEYYELETELEDSLDHTLHRLERDGFLAGEPEVAE
jgi:NTP pyrophosphatase (non-canonical NTP hydrolase)